MSSSTVVLYGPFINRAARRAAITRMPAAQKQAIRRLPAPPQGA